MQILEEEKKAKDAIKKKEVELGKTLYKKYKELTEKEIKTLVVEDKWMISIETTIQSEADRISQRLTTRIKELADRYKTPLPELEKNTEALSKKVDKHLKQMGFEV